MAPPAEAPAAPLDAAAAFERYSRGGAGVGVSEVRPPVQGQEAAGSRLAWPPQSVAAARHLPSRRPLQLRKLLADLGKLQGRSPDAAATFVAQQFALADRRSRDGRLDSEEFRRYYAKATAPRLLEVLGAEMPVELAALRSVFQSFAAFGAASKQPVTEIDGVRSTALCDAVTLCGACAATFSVAACRYCSTAAGVFRSRLNSELHLMPPHSGPQARFSKLCKESGLVGRRWGLSTTDADLAFAGCKERAARKISFEQVPHERGRRAWGRGGLLSKRAGQGTSTSLKGRSQSSTCVPPDRHSFWMSSTCWPPSRGGRWRRRCACWPPPTRPS